MENLEHIGRQLKSDKIWHHGYHRFYERFLEPLRTSPISMLEIGLDEGYSIPLWNLYFPFVQMYGFDLKPPRQYAKKLEMIVGDQSRLEDLKSLVKKVKENQIAKDKNPELNFIIDDGSHIPEHQILTFNHLFNHLLCNGGVYIVEDIETSYWKVGDCYGYRTNYGLGSPKSCVEQFKPLIDAVNWEFLNEKDRRDLIEKLKFFSQEALSFPKSKSLNIASSINFLMRSCKIIKKCLKNNLLKNAKPMLTLLTLSWTLERLTSTACPLMKKHPKLVTMVKTNPNRLQKRAQEESESFLMLTQ